jgi:uncharacterized protein YutE (UPF0331/DUF86 family)
MTWPNGGRHPRGLRNVLTHEYVRVDLERVAAAVPEATRDFGAYVQQVARFIAALGD